MRYRLLALTLAASLAAIPFGVASRVVAQTSRTAPAEQDADMQAIQINVLTVKGMKFPKLSQANAKTNGQRVVLQKIFWPQLVAAARQVLVQHLV